MLSNGPTVTENRWENGAWGRPSNLSEAASGTPSPKNNGNKSWGPAPRKTVPLCSCDMQLCIT